ncbi:MAG TPA: hypothetical protein VKH61_02970 [Streptosporangiaceae bacterium]|nr:hypothetical protein [Streptosporangiaceae bacterium]
MNKTEGDEPAATEDDTRAALLDRSKRNFAPVNKLFVQAAPGSTSRPGPLATFVHNRDLRGLHAYLLLLGITSSGDSQDGWSTTLPIGVWARAFGTTRDATPASAASAVSKVLTRLEQRNLIDRQRHGRERRIRITLLREDGSGQPYTRPGKGNTDRFLRLPHAFWRDGWHEQLDLPATAMLLVALHEKNNFELPTERVPEWYGWSADTAERGLATLEHLNLLTHITRLKKAPLSPTGLTKINRYLLHEPFGQLTIDDIFNDDVIEAIVSPAPPKNRPSKTTAGATRNRAGS